MAKSTKKKKSVVSVKYTGELATPIIELPLVGEFFGKDAQAAQLQYYSHQRDAKLRALFEWYSIDQAAPDAWERLALSLARDHVPGMDAQPSPKKRGRSPFWEDGANAARLVREVENLRGKNKGMTVEKAIQTLLKGNGWAGLTRENLGVRYREARRTEEMHRRLCREWKENPGGGQVALLKALGVDLETYFAQQRLKGFKID